MRPYIILTGVAALNAIGFAMATDVRMQGLSGFAVVASLLAMLAVKYASE